MINSRMRWGISAFALALIWLLSSLVDPGTVHAAKASVATQEAKKTTGVLQATIIGQVTDSQNSPVANATVKWSLDGDNAGLSQTVQTDQLGNYHIVVSLSEESTESYYFIKAEADGYIKELNQFNYNLVSLKSGQTRTVNFILFEPSTIVGKVTDNNGITLSGVTVKVVNGDNHKLLGQTKTDKQGRYAIGNLDPFNNESPIVTFETDGYLTRTEYIYLPQENIYELNVYLEQEARVKGKVVNEQGNPVVGATVSIYSYKATTDAQGNYSFKQLLARSTTISVSAKDYDGQSISAQLSVGDNTVNFTLKGNKDLQAPVTQYRLTPITKTHNGESYVSGFSMRLLAKDEAGGSGVQITKYRFNGGAWLTYEGPVRFYAPDVKVVEYYSTDAAGNKEKLNKMDFVNGKFEGAGSF